MIAYRILLVALCASFIQARAGSITGSEHSKAAALGTAPGSLAAVVSRPGELDVSFDPAQGVEQVGLATDEATVRSLILQPDGHILVAGWFKGVNGKMMPNMARLTANGGLDTGFKPPLEISERVGSIALQSDGKVLTAGSVVTEQQTLRPMFARLTWSGALDPTFAPVFDSDGWGQSVVPLPDGKVLIRGCFTSVNGVARPGLAQLNADGSLDLEFNPDPAAVPQLGEFSSLAAQSDGKVLLGANPSEGKPSLTRLNPDGTVDMDFHQPTVMWHWGGKGTVSVIALQADGRMLIAGTFDLVDGQELSCLARLNSDGTLDSSFAPGADVRIEQVKTLALQDDGLIIAGGEFTELDWTGARAVMRFHDDGTQDVSFDAEAAIDTANCLALHPDGRVLVGGRSSRQGAALDHILLLGPDGAQDNTLATHMQGFGAQVRTLAVEHDGKVWVGGRFGWVNDVWQPNLARFNPDGSLDSTARPAFGTRQGINMFTISALLAQPDGKLLVGGEFHSVNGIVREGVVRLNPDSNVDEGFDPDRGQTGSGNVPVWSLALDPNGKVLVGGSFFNYQGTGRNMIIRLESDGALDVSFDPGKVFGADYSGIRTIAAQPDGKILIGGELSSIAQQTCYGLARLEPNGALDADFHSKVGVRQWSVSTILLQPDGKIIVAGRIGVDDAVRGAEVVRLERDGSLDTAFNAEREPWGTAFVAALQPDGKILLGGWLPLSTDAEHHQVIRLDQNGALDQTWMPSEVDYVGALALDASGKVLVGGEFDEVQGVPRSGIARLHGDPRIAGPFELSLRCISRRMILRIVGGEPGTYEVQASIDLEHWSSVGTVEKTLDDGEYNVSDWNSQAWQFFRVLKPAQ